MKMDEILKQTGPVMPVLVIDKLEDAIPLAKALVSSGVTVLEVTLRTPVALDAVRAIGQEVPEACVGVGTVTLPGQLEAAKEAGAEFAVSPGLSEKLLKSAEDAGIPFLPGAAVPSDIILAAEHGMVLEACAQPALEAMGAEIELKDGYLTYGEYIIPGESNKEVFLSTYVCHPSMANNELSGPVVAAFIGKWLASQPRRYTYRIIFIPETIGSITYLSRHLQELKQNVIVGFNISCVGDERAYSYVASRYGNTFADKVASNVLSFEHPDFIKYSFLDRGSDERQYCSPGVDLPLVTISRSKYGTYPEYHTSLDNLDLVTAAGLHGGYELIKTCIKVIENNKTYRVVSLGEPQLGKRGLYPNLSTKKSNITVKTMMDFIAYADGTNDLIEISNIIGKPVMEVVPIAERLLESGLLEEVI